ncbi:MAG: PDZ domain-containing protein [Planctomycetota bacterium]
MKNPTIASAAALVCLATFGCAPENQVNVNVTKEAEVVSVAPAATMDARSIASIQDRAIASMVIVEFTFDFERGREKLRGLGTVIDDQGTTMVSLELLSPFFPNEQIVDFKYIMVDRATGIETELDAVFSGRDERYGVAFVRPAEGVELDVPPLTFVDDVVEPGELVVSVSRMGKPAMYQPYVQVSRVMANVRGPVPQTLVSSSGLGMIGSPVFNTDGVAVGFVNSSDDHAPFMDIGNGEAMRSAFQDAPRQFHPAGDFLPALENPPTPESPIRMSNLGVAALSGLLDKEIAKFYDLEGTPTVVIGDVIDGFPAAEAGVQSGDMVIAVDGAKIPQGDTPEEAPEIFQRSLMRRSVGEEVTLTVIRDTPDGVERLDVPVTLGERPQQENAVEREYFEDLGFTVREVVFADLYNLKADPDTTGVVVSFIRPQSAAQTGTLGFNDLITDINQLPVESIEQFTQVYKALREETPEEDIVLTVRRGVDTEIVRIEPPRE